MRDVSPGEGSGDAGRPADGVVQRTEAGTEPWAVDLSPLRSSPGARRRLEDAILAAASGELARRAAAGRVPLHAPRGAGRSAADGLLPLLARWAGPTLAAAAVLAALSVAGFALARRDAAAPVDTPASAGTLVGALELPEPASTWLAEDRGPGTDDLILAVQEDLP